MTRVIGRGKRRGGARAGAGRPRDSIEDHRKRGTYRRDRHGERVSAAQVITPGRDFFAPAKGHPNHAVMWFKKYLRHVIGRQWAGKAFTLLPWQRDQIIRPLFGTRRSDGMRQYRTAYIEIPRKNGKSTLAAGIALYLLFADREDGAEIYSAAANRDQARIVFDTAWRMIEASPTLDGLAKLYRGGSRAIVVPSTGSVYRALSADAYTKHGLNAHAIIVDELHAQPTRDLWDVLTTSTGARKQPLTVAITTAGYDRTSICYELHEYAQKIRAGVVHDPSFLAVVYGARSEDDWQDPKVWKSANPGFGITVGREYLEEEAARAAELPASQNNFRRLHLNQWTQQSTRWIDLRLWDENAGLPFDETALAGLRTYGGLDLSSVSDLTALVYVFPSAADTDEVRILCRFWCPEARLHDSSNRYRAEYQAWQRAGYLRTTPGEAVDYGFIREAILQDAKRFRIARINFDPWRAFDLASKLLEERVPMVEMRQGFKSFAAPMLEFERRLRSRKLRHGGHPVLRWNADNVTVKTDPAGNLKPDREGEQGKIDGIVALVMALEGAMRDEGGSVYETRGVRSLDVDA